MTDVSAASEPLWPYLTKRWDEPRLDASEVAKVLGVRPTTVRQNLLVEAAGFPAPEARGANGRNLWPPSAVYRYVLAYHPRRRDHIPRLFTPTTDLNPGRFLYAQSVVLPRSKWAEPGERGDEYVLHHWRPSDGGGPVAIAYPINARHHRGTRGAAIELFRQLSSTTTAIAVPREDASLVVRPGRDAVWQPAMWVTDASTISGERDVEKVREYGWYEIARLLQTNLPWWPRVLRDRDAMLTWQPGDPTQKVQPAVGAYTPQPLLDLITAGVSPTLRRILTGLAAAISNDLARSAEGEADNYPQHPGLVHAAVTDVDPAQPGLGRRSSDIALLLHHPVTDTTLADRALAAAKGHPVITEVMTITPKLAGHPLVSRWCAGLVPASTDRRQELGNHLLERMRTGSSTSPTAPVTHWYAHEQDPNIWAVQTQDGTVYTTVGSSVPASGRLRTALVTDDAAFFETTSGVAWPLPHKALGGYNAGYDGAGPQDLTQALSRLLLDASADVDDYDGRVAEDAEFRRAIRSQPLPITLTS